MAVASYIVPSLDLAAPRDRAQISGTFGAPVATVKVLALPGGQLASLHIGEQSQPIPLAQGDSYEICPAETTGLYLTNPVGAGALLLLVSFELGAVETAAG